MSDRPRPDLVPTSSPSGLGLQKAKSRFPHESTSSPRPLPMQGRGRGRGGNLVPTASRTNKFAANTCHKCSAIILAGTTYGLRLDLEPRQLDDQTEVDALADNVPTYNLLPDRTAQRRHLEEIRGSAKHPRHAQHTCGRQYGHHSPPPAPATPSTTDDRPPF